MKNKLSFLLFLIFVIPLLSSCGCISFNTASQPKSIDGGIYKSTDRGTVWHQKTAVLTLDKNANSIGDLAITVMELDPQDSQTLYIGTETGGIYYSYDDGNSWMQPRQKVNSGKIYDIAVDPFNKCELLVSKGKILLKSSDCARTWESVFLSEETVPLSEISTINYDYQNRGRIYLGSNDGNFYLSENHGLTWKVINRFMTRIVKTIILENNSNIIYVGTQNRGIHKSVDRGLSWEDLSPNYSASFPGSMELYEVKFMGYNENEVIFSSRFGLLKTSDGGLNWEGLELLTEKTQIVIRAFAINRNAPKEIYYATDSNFNRSYDGGDKWNTSSLVSTRTPSLLSVNPDNPEVLYLGLSLPK